MKQLCRLYAQTFFISRTTLVFLWNMCETRSVALILFSMILTCNNTIYVNTDCPVLCYVCIEVNNFFWFGRVIMERLCCGYYSGT